MYWRKLIAVSGEKPIQNLVGKTAGVLISILKIKK